MNDYNTYVQDSWQILQYSTLIIMMVNFSLEMAGKIEGQGPKDVNQ